ncbi:MAG: helix-turn-helix domain-containing protein [Salibacteraceae bacterium]
MAAFASSFHNMYQEFAPVTPFAEALWSFSGNRHSESFKVQPDSCTDLIVDLKRNACFVSGAMTAYQQRQLSAEANLLGLRFKTEHFALLTEVPLQEIRNLRTDSVDVLPFLPHHLPAQLQELNSLAERKTVLKKAFEPTLIKHPKAPDRLVLSVAYHIRQRNGQVQAHQLATAHHISLRQLERRFKSFVGLTLKEFSTIVRFCAVKKAIQNQPKSSLLSIAFETGYFDHAHLYNDFKRLSGEKPSAFR